MTHFLEKTLSLGRLKTYEILSAKQEEERSAEELYAVNIMYSKELYVMLGGLEVAVRNSFHKALKNHFKTDDWLSLDIFLKKHKDQIDQATKHVSRIKKDHFTIDDVIAHLNYGFWVNLCNSPYEKKLWNKALYKCFPYLGQKPDREDILRRLKRTNSLRNKIAHLEPILKRESLLIQEHRNISELLYAICPQTQEWFQSICNFEDIWNNRNKGVSS